MVTGVTDQYFDQSHDYKLVNIRVLVVGHLPKIQSISFSELIRAVQSFVGILVLIYSIAILKLLATSETESEIANWEARANQIQSSDLINQSVDKYILIIT